MAFVAVYVMVACSIVGSLVMLLIIAHLALKPGWRPKVTAGVLFLALALLPALTGWGPFT